MPKLKRIQTTRRELRVASFLMLSLSPQPRDFKRSSSQESNFNLGLVASKVLRELQR
jgi:hypothetical protein